MKLLLKMVCGIVLFLLVLALGVNVTGGMALERELAAIRKEGDLVQLSDIELNPIPASENAAAAYEKAFRLLPRYDVKEKETIALFLRGRLSAVRPDFAARDRKSPVGKTDLAALRGIVAKAEPALAAARQGTDRPRSRFSVNWKAGSDAMFPHYARLREMARLFAIRAAVRARDGDADGALGDIDAIVAMAGHMSSEPILISRLVEYAILSLAGSSLERALSGGAPGEEAARRLSERIAGIDPYAGYAATMAGERAYGIDSLETLRASGVTPSLKWDETGYLRVMRTVIDRARQDASEAKAGRLDRAIAKEGFPSERDAAWYARISRTLLPALQKSAVKRDEVAIRLRLMRWGLAFNRFKTEHGRYPASLEEAAGNPDGASLDDADPYAGKDRPFRYQASGDGYLLYSVGMNRKDDGGETKRRGGAEGAAAVSVEGEKTVSPDDITWRIPSTR